MRKNKKILGIALAAALVAGLFPVNLSRAESGVAERVVKDEVTEENPEASETPEVTEAPSESPSPTPVVTTNPVAPENLSLNIKSVNRMVGKSFKLTLKGVKKTENPDGTVVMPAVSFVSGNTSVATVGTQTVGDDSVSVKVKLKKKGSTQIEVSAYDVILTCKVTVVAKMSKSDFGMYKPKNFITFCKQHKKWAYKYYGEWGVPKSGDKYGSTYRGIRYGSTLSAVQKAYGEVTLKKCKRAKTAKKGDPFLYLKRFNKGKKLKVSKYCDLDYGKYKIRFYFTSKKKVYAFTMIEGMSKVTRSTLKNEGLALI